MKLAGTSAFGLRGTTLNYFEGNDDCKREM